MNARLTSLDVSYGHTLPSDAGRELAEPGRTVDLRSVTVEAVVENDSERHGFELTYVMDHEAARLTLDAVEPQYNDHAPAAELSRAAELADDAVHAWLADTGKDIGLRNTLSDPGVRGNATVWTDMKVSK